MKPKKDNNFYICPDPRHEKEVADLVKEILSALEPFKEVKFVGIANEETGIAFILYVEHKKNLQRFPNSYEGYPIIVTKIERVVP